MDSRGHSPSRGASGLGSTVPERTAAAGMAVDGSAARCTAAGRKVEDSSTLSVAEEPTSVRNLTPLRSDVSTDAAAKRCSESMLRAVMLCRHSGVDKLPVLAASHPTAMKPGVAGAFLPEALMAGACTSHCDCRCSRNQNLKTRRTSSVRAEEHCT
jgi:hypothetical protein